MEQIVRKNGLLYTPDLHTVLGVDVESGEFKGRVPFGAHYIDEEVFTECPYEKMELTDSIVGIGAALFKDSPKLKVVKLPEKVTELPPYLFSGCRALERVKMPNVVYSFPEGLFQNCSSLTDIPFRAGIRELSPFVFEGCSSLLSLVIPPTVERIEERAVAGCTKLTTVVLPVALKELDESAFDACPNIRNIRISEENELFYVSEEDGCLYERTEAGDKLRLSVAGIQAQQVDFIKENVDEDSEAVDREIERFYTDEDFYEEDDDFSAEVGAGEDTAAGADEVREVDEVARSEESAQPDLIDREIAQSSGFESVNENIGEDTIEDIIPDQEKASSDNAAVSEAELANLFSSGEEEEAPDVAVTVKITDSKTQAILDSVEYYELIECPVEEELPSDSDLFVVAEMLIDSDEEGEKTFTPKLKAVAKRFAQIQHFKRIFMLYGLPFDNEEFAEFYKLYVSNRNVIFACLASCPANLSEYGKKVCDYSRIDLSAEALAEQKSSAASKNDLLIKLIIQDKK